MSKLSIKAETEADKYDIGKMVICYSCEAEVDIAEKTVSLYLPEEGLKI